jgi:Rieske Fe-S protein
MAQDTNRRSFLGWAIMGLGAIFSVILGIPAVCYTIDPRHRKGRTSNFKPVEGIQLSELSLNKPVQGVIRDTRRDGWTLYPSDVVGRVWVILIRALPQAPLTDANKDAHVLVFTTICPHLGCSVNLNDDENGFLCPCHAAAFQVNGVREDAPGHANPAARNMDSLNWKIDPSNPDRIVVQYQNFLPSKPTKELIA